MRTFNRNNTENVKQARKESKQLRKLKMSKLKMSKLKMHKLKMSKHTTHILDTKGDEVKTLDVIEVFNIVQHHGIAWCELN